MRKLFTFTSSLRRAYIRFTQSIAASLINRRVAQIDRLRATCVPQAEEVSSTEELPCESLGSQRGL
jgi:hypothetical protein